MTKGKTSPWTLWCCYHWYYQFSFGLKNISWSGIHHTHFKVLFIVTIRVLISCQTVVGDTSPPPFSLFSPLFPRKTTLAKCWPNLPLLMKDNSRGEWYVFCCMFVFLWIATFLRCFLLELINKWNVSLVSTLHFDCCRLLLQDAPILGKPTIFAANNLG